ncbi:branched-chain amino acid aminotransferase [Sporosarcina jiandibaonis]|uniref:branched-chain amino acid aminotransferase n=1 Tax=Sporosarcina jiandibaonis TaxID=2715535 RepID=UPI001FE3A7E2|nr:branched-chain amino acid aminotransferase [Sporosarcina jiandibaonis]
MIKKQLELYIAEALQNNPGKIELHKVEKEYAEKHQLLPAGVEVVLKDAASLFSDAYLERCEKETVALIIVETPKFLEEKIEHLKTHMREFLYVESKSFDLVGIDAISLEVDDVFETYTAMFGLKMKKKYEARVKEYLEANLTGERGKYSVAFSGKDGLFDINFAVDYSAGFNEEMTFLEAYDLIYSFVFSMVAEIEDAE